jgi:histidine triad (HIT) family protein
MNTIPSRAPEEYDCPICLGLKGIEDERTLIRSTDIVYSDETVTVFINSFFMGKNAGHVIVVPNTHFENVYTLPAEQGHHIFDVAKQMAAALKQAYDCDGVTIKQNNEPAGDQHAFHYHLHVFPRYDDDGFNAIQPSEKRLAEPSERAEYAKKLKAAL